MLHSTCWSHILHLVAEEVRGKLKLADGFISAMKKSVIKAPARRLELLDAYEKRGYARVLAPVPVLTRWCTWLEAGAFHYARLDAVQDWTEQTEDNSAAIKTITKTANKSKLKDELKVISELTPGLTSAIKILETDGLPASSVWLQLKVVLGLTKEVLGNESEKLKLYLDTKHPALTFWQEVQYLDPRIASQFQNFDEEGLPPSLQRFSEDPPANILPELLKYREIRQNYHFDEKFDVFKFWVTFSREMPLLSKLCLKSLSVPSSSAAVERSFSGLKRILTPLRNNLTESSLGVHLRLNLNSNFVNLPNTDDGDSNEDASSSEED